MANPIAEYADGTRKQWDGGSWVDIAPISKGFDAASNSQKYQDKLAQARATSDMARLDAGAKSEEEAYTNETTANRAREVLDEDTPTGSMAGMRIAAGRAVGSPLAHTLSLGFVPTKDQTANLETVQGLGNQGALGAVGQLKGPLSDRDVQFLKTLQYSADATPAYNKRVVEAQTWLSHRQAAYAAAQRTWTERLGSPSALNDKGVSFDRWWGDYSSKTLPPPNIAKPRTGDDLKARSASRAPKILSIEPGS